MQKKIMIWHSCLCKIGGVETFLYNFCEQLRNYYDIIVVYGSGDAEQLNRLRKLVKVIKYDNTKEYECDICLRNTVWGMIPKKIKAKKYYEMQHANYMNLKARGELEKQNIVWDKIQQHIACGEFVKKMYKEATGNDSIVIKNILGLKRPTNKIIKLITCSRLDTAKGWGRMQQMMDMMRIAGIKFQWDIFTTGIKKCDYEEVIFHEPRFDIWDYIANADYTVLLSDCEGLPYTVQESIQYDTPCIVTDIGGCTELIKHGVNGYVVPLDMKFNINIIKDIPVIQGYKGTSAEDWCKVLGDAVYEERKVNDTMVKVRALRSYSDGIIGRQVKANEVFTIEEERAEELIRRSTANGKQAIIEIIETVIEEATAEEVKEVAVPKKKKNAKK